MVERPRTRRCLILFLAGLCWLSLLAGMASAIWAIRWHPPWVNGKVARGPFVSLEAGNLEVGWISPPNEYSRWAWGINVEASVSPVVGHYAYLVAAELLRPTGGSPPRDDNEHSVCRVTSFRMPSNVTRVLSAIDSGDPRAAAELLPLVYQELRKLADARLAQERPGQTLQATALVHEAYLRLVGPDHDGDRNWDSRGHFFAAAAEAMRRILIDQARARGAVKRGGAAQRLTLDPTLLSLDSVPSEIVDLDEALTRFEAEDPQKAALVKLWFFGGLTLKQAAAALGLPSTTADRHWAYARAWLFQALSAED